MAMVFELHKEIGGLDETRCEMQHSNPAKCTVHVTHRLAWCSGAINVCQQSVDSKTREMAKEGSRCARCSHLARECWTLRPI
jgi:hypothetical protein